MTRIFALVCVLVGVAAAKTDFSSDHVVHLTEKNFAEKTGDGSLWFIKFYAPWCGHCKKLAPTWGDIGAHFKDNQSVKIAHVDCTTDKEVCQKAEVKGYPTLKTFFNGEEHKKFEGMRSAEKLKEFVNGAFTELFSETTA